jgi:hypothetical protein
MKRLFTFGCSFTNYAWPTWADIVGQDYDYYENWGYRGSNSALIMMNGDDSARLSYNTIIQDRFIKCIQYNNITTDDTVIIMWSGPTTVSPEYPQETATHMQNSYDALYDIGCNYHMFSVLPFDIHPEVRWIDCNEQLPPAISDPIVKLYPVLKQIPPSVWEGLFNKNFHNRDYHAIGNVKSNKPTRLLSPNGPEVKKFNRDYNAVAGGSWPTFNDFLNEKDDKVDASIMKEIDEEFGFVEWRRRIKYGRRDLHPTPMEHLEYLDYINFPVSNKARSFAAHWEEQISAGTANWTPVLPEKL